MTWLFASSAFFFVLHRVISGSLLRARMVGLVGERRFSLFFSIASAAGLAWLAATYLFASQFARELLWDVPSFARYAQFLLQPAALLLIVTGLTTPNPGTVGQESTIEEPELVRGALRVTRHPFLWGIALLGAGHMAAVPSPRSLLVFGTLALVALVGTTSIDSKRRVSLGARWTPFVATTSNVPFAAILAGRQTFRLDEFGIRPLAAAAVLAAAFWLLHPTAGFRS